MGKGYQIKNELKLSGDAVKSENDCEFLTPNSFN